MPTSLSNISFLPGRIIQDCDQQTSSPDNAQAPPAYSLDHQYSLAKLYAICKVRVETGTVTESCYAF